MEVRQNGFTPGKRYDNPRVKQEQLRKVAAREDVTPKQPAEAEPFNLKADKRYREAKVLLRWLQQYKNDFDSIQETGKIFEWTPGTGERYAVVNEELADMVDEKMETEGFDDPRMAAKLLQQELFTRGFDQVQYLRRQPGLNTNDSGELDAMYWNFDDVKPGKKEVA